MRRKKQQSKNNSGPLLLMGGGGLVILGLLVWLAISGQQKNVANPGLDVPFPTVARISLADAKQAYDSSNAVFVDVRDTGSFSVERISGAVNIPLTEFESRINELSKDQWIITYCT